MGRRNVINTILLVLGVSAVLFVIGLVVIESGPSEATVEAGRVPTTTTTTEPPPEGTVIVRLNNAVFRPANLAMDLDEAQIVEWVIEDDAEYIIRSSTGLFESPPLGLGDTFQFDFSTVEEAIHRYAALIGFQRIPGSVDTRPEQ